MQTLVIRLPRADDPSKVAQWVIVDAAGMPVSAPANGTLTEAAPFAAGCAVIALISGMDVVLAEPELPVKNAAKLAQIAPFALEDQLAGNVEDHHFVIGKRSANSTRTPVAAVTHERMQSAVESLQAAGIQPDKVIPDTALLPVTANGLTVVVEKGCIYTQRGEHPAAVLDVEPLIEGLQLALASGADAHEHVILYITPAEYEQDQDLIEGLREFTASLQVKLLANDALPLLAAAAATQPAMNLLQGKYAPHSPLQFSLGPWKIAAALAGVLVAMHLGSNLYHLRQLTGEEKRLDASLAQTFSQVMPGVKLVDPRAQVQGRLNSLRAGANASGLLQGLSSLGEALAQAPGARLEALVYGTNTLDLRITAPNVDALDRIQHAATERGLTAKIQSATPRDNRVDGRLQLKSPGA